MSANLNLGKIITTKQNRDAIHVAVAPVAAGENLKRGQRIYLSDGKAFVEVRGNRDADAIGIVDPFLPDITIKSGQWFWLFLFPNTITALRHEWTHPAFADESPTYNEIIREYARLIEAYNAATGAHIDTTEYFRCACQTEPENQLWQRNKLN